MPKAPERLNLRIIQGGKHEGEIAAVWNGVGQPMCTVHRLGYCNSGSPQFDNMSPSDDVKDIANVEYVRADTIPEPKKPTRLELAAKAVVEALVLQRNAVAETSRLFDLLKEREGLVKNAAEALANSQNNELMAKAKVEELQRKLSDLVWEK